MAIAATSQQQPSPLPRTGTEPVQDHPHPHPHPHPHALDRLLGVSAVMRRLFALLPRIAAARATVLLEGETGTGKNVVAEALHRASGREGPLVPVDCGAIPATLIESELFGHERGAFTGAHTTRTGAFQSAQGGTVFLDEIGELPLDLQPKLLRVLEERTVKRVGSQRSERLDIRLIAATNRDLERQVDRGSFRSDLYYRLNVVHLRIPPLRERPEDIPPLTAHFYRQLAPDDPAGPPPAMVAMFLRHRWPGNVRELRAAVERAVLLGDPWPLREGAGRPATASAADDDPAGALDEVTSFRLAKEQAMASWERAYLTQLIQRHGRNLTHAARAARMDRNYLRDLLVKHQLRTRQD